MEAVQGHVFMYHVQGRLARRAAMRHVPIMLHDTELAKHRENRKLLFARASQVVKAVHVKQRSISDPFHGGQVRYI